MRIPFSGLHSWARTVLSRPSQRTSDHGLGKSPPTSPQGVPGGLELLHVSRELPDIQGVQAMSQDDSLFTSVKFGELRMGPSSETLQTPVRRTRGHIYNLQSTSYYLPGGGTRSHMDPIVIAIVRRHTDRKDTRDTHDTCATLRKAEALMFYRSMVSSAWAHARPWPVQPPLDSGDQTQSPHWGIRGTPTPSH